MSMATTASRPTCPAKSVPRASVSSRPLCCSVAFPALASRVREGHDIEKTYLGVLSYLSAIYWPGVALVSLLAPAIVTIVLGPQWEEAIPVVRILSLAAVFWPPVIVTGPLLLALGCNRDAFIASLIARCLAAGILCIASLHGVMAMALSQFVSLPLQMLVALVLVHRHVPFSVPALLTALMPSAVERLMTRLPLLRMLPVADPVVPPLPIWSVPAEMVVPAGKALFAARMSVPSPSFVSVLPAVLSAVAKVTFWLLVSMR